VFHLTGGGSLLLSDLLTEPGASATVLAATVPYTESALATTLGGAPDQACSAATALALSMAAWQQARQLAPGADNLFGFGCTAALATNRPKRGPHRAYLAVQTLDTTSLLTIEFNKADTDRPREEQALLEHSYQLLAKALAIDLPPKASQAAKGTHSDHFQVVLSQHQADPSWRALLSGASVAEAQPAGGAGVQLIFPGAFNPFHEGHRQMAAYASQHHGTPVAFEISIDNVDKPALTYLDLGARVQQFANRPLWLTTLPTFIEKARHFQGTTFVVGVDTLQRIGQQRYYNNAAAMEDALAEMAMLNVNFMVFGRMTDAGFSTLDSIQLPRPLRALCQGVAENEFRSDLSSSTLR
jgi:hypothetical protein